MVLLAVAFAAVGCTSGLAGGGTPTSRQPAPNSPNQVSPAVPAPGTLNPAVTQQTIRSTICVTGFTKTIRPASADTTRIKRAQIAAYGYADTDLAHYEEDHVVSLELGGAASAPVNLFPEPHSVSGADDGLENQLNAQVCSGALTLADAQTRITTVKVAHGYRPDVSASVG